MNKLPKVELPPLPEHWAAQVTTVIDVDADMAVDGVTPLEALGLELLWGRIYAGRAEDAARHTGDEQLEHAARFTNSNAREFEAWVDTLADPRVLEFVAVLTLKAMTIKSHQHYLKEWYSIPDTVRGRRIFGASKKGHEAVHGTPSMKAARHAEIVNAFKEKRKKRPDLSAEDCYKLVAAEYGKRHAREKLKSMQTVSPQTVKRLVREAKKRQS